MKMAGKHHSSNFKNKCVTPPRDPYTRLPLTRREINTEAEFNDGNEQYIDEDGKFQCCVKGLGLQKNTANTSNLRDANIEEPNEPVNQSREIISNRSHTSNQEKGNKTNLKSVFNPSPGDLSDLLQDDDKFFSHLQSLKMENKKTLKILDRLYNSYTYEDGTVAQDGTYVPLGAKQAWQGQDIYDSIVSTPGNGIETKIVDATDRMKDLEFTRDRNINDIQEGEESEGSDDSEDSRYDYFQEWRQKKAYAPPNILPDEDTAQFRGRHSSYDIIDGMWDRFSVEDYAQDETSPQPAVQPVKDQWTPKITIPKPFNMTVRESLQADQRAKRRERIAQDLMKKTLADEAELEKKFRATPLPPSTYLPLYEELRFQQEERREQIRDLSKALLKSKVKPFNFTKREEAIKATREQDFRERMAREEKKEKKPDSQFKAHPFPEKLFNLSVEDKLAEHDLYRKIRIEMRSKELLASSSLPPNMKARGEKYAIRREKRLQKLAEAHGKQFHPAIHRDIPNFEALQRNFNAESMRKKLNKEPTVCRPFNLHTAEIAERRSVKSRQSTEDSFQSSSQRGRTSKASKSSDTTKSFSTPQSDTIPYSLTETSRLRQDLLRRSREAKTREEEAVKAKEKQRKKRERVMRRRVMVKSSPNDLKTAMKLQADEKIKEFRRSDAARQKEYRDQMRELRSRLDDRPFLFERESQLNARRKAEKRYQQILLDAGVDVNIVDDLMSRDGDTLGDEYVLDENETLSEDEGSGVVEDQSQMEQSTYESGQRFENTTEYRQGQSASYESEEALSETESFDEEVE